MCKHLTSRDGLTPWLTQVEERESGGDGSGSAAAAAAGGGAGTDGSLSATEEEVVVMVVVLVEGWKQRAPASLPPPSLPLLMSFCSKSCGRRVGVDGEA